MSEIRYKKPWRTITPTYGRHCGLNYTGGEVDGKNTNILGINSFDEACRQHDIYYKEHPNEPKSIADFALSAAIYKLKDTEEYKKLSLLERGYINEMALLMGEKAALGFLTDIPRVFLDSNTDKKVRNAFKLNGGNQNRAEKKNDSWLSKYNSFAQKHNMHSLRFKLPIVPE